MRTGRRSSHRTQPSAVDTLTSGRERRTRIDERTRGDDAMITTGTMTAGMAGMAHAHGAAGMGGMGGHNHGGKADPRLPGAHDPRFMDLTVGRPEQAGSLGKYVQAGGAGYGGRDGEDVNNQKDKNEIIDRTDANHLPQYGVLPGQNYVQAIQSYTGLSAIKDLAGMQGFPLSEQDWNTIVALQDRGGSPVLAVVNYLTGLTNDLPRDLPQDIAAKRDAVASFQVPGSGRSVNAIAIDPKDVSGNNIARSHHSADWFGNYRNLTDMGIPAEWAYSLAFSDDGTSGNGRFNGFNEQDGNPTGANDGEDAYFKMVATASQQLGRPDMFFQLLAGGHNHTALDPSVMTSPKINQLIGWNPPNDQTMSPERVEAIRQYYLRPDVAVNQGDFNRHVGSLPASLRSQLDFTGVQFAAQEAGGEGAGNDAGGAEGAGNGEAPAEPTGAGGGAAPVAVGGGDIAPPGLPGSPTITTRPPLELLGVGGPFPVLDPATGKLNKALQDQLMTAYIDVVTSMNDSPFLDEPAERAAFVDGATKGVQFLKDEVAVSSDAVSALKAELATALADGSLTDEERSSLAQKLNEAGMTDVAKAVEDGTASEAEVATLHEQVDGAASAKLEKDITTAMEDGTLTPEERASIEGRLGKDGLDALERGIADGTVTAEELTAIADGTRTDETARKATAPSGTVDAATGADTAADATPADPTKPAAAGTDADAGAGQLAAGAPAASDRSGDATKAAGSGDTAKTAGSADGSKTRDGDAPKPAASETPKPASDGGAPTSAGAADAAPAADEPTASNEQPAEAAAA